jgi:hypothetical protein
MDERLHISSEFREQVAAETGLLKSMLDPNGPNSDKSSAA